jgi:hypothetical protein
MTMIHMDLIAVLSCTDRGLFYSLFDVHNVSILSFILTSILSITTVIIVN